MIPEISVLMTVYNGEAYVHSAVESVLNQMGVDFELIIINNGSSDGTVAILESFEDPRIDLVHSEPLGRTGALIFAFNRARAPLIAVHDADDLSRPDRLAVQSRFLREHPEIALVGSWANLIDEQGKVYGDLTPLTNHGGIRDGLANWGPIAHSSVLFRTEDARAVGGYSAEYPFAQDSALYTSLIEQGRLLANIPEKLVSIREHRGRWSHAKQASYDKAWDRERIHARIAALPDISPDVRRKARRAISLTRFERGQALLGQKQYGRSCGLMLSAFGMAPAYLVGRHLYERWLGLGLPRLAPLLRRIMGHPAEKSYENHVDPDS